MITVITGPIFSEKMQTLKSGLPIPESFFKIVIDETPPKKTIAFIYHQTDKGDLLSQRVQPLPALFKKVAYLKNSLEPQSLGKRKPANLEDWKAEKCY